MYRPVGQGSVGRKDMDDVIYIVAMVGLFALFAAAVYAFEKVE